jgi:uncharacterized protein
MQILHHNGYAVLPVDLRARGESEHDVVTLGLKERHDIDAAVAFLRQQPEVAWSAISVIGKSAGGVAAILAAADNPTIGAVVAESSFARLDDIVAYNLRQRTGLPSFPFAPIALWLAERLSGCRISQVVPQERVGRLSPRPLLLIHAEDDTVVRIDQSEKLYGAAGEPKQFWRVPGSVHMGSCQADPPGWEARVVSLLDMARQHQDAADRRVRYSRPRRRGASLPTPGR